MRKLMMIMAVAAAAAAGQPTIAAAGYSGYCEELRLACEHKDSLGETGGGNCKAYRQTCQQHVSCRSLRHYCLHKDEYGLQGQGYCETYRESCR